MAGPLLSSEEKLPMPGMLLTLRGASGEDVFIFIMTGYWSTVPLTRAPSTPGFSLTFERPCNSRASEAGSSSTHGGGGYRDRIVRNDPVDGIMLVRFVVACTVNL